MTHDYKRNGTTTLFAALDILEGKVIGRCMQRHRHQEFIRFLNTVEREVAADKAVHVVLDNYATHKHPRVRAWLTRHPRFTFHFTPTSCSWANAVEGWFAKLTRQRLKRGVFTSIVELQTAINHFIAEVNGKPKPFVWTKSSDAILAAADVLGAMGAKQTLAEVGLSISLITGPCTDTPSMRQRAQALCGIVAINLVCDPDRGTQRNLSGNSILA